MRSPRERALARCLGLLPRFLADRSYDVAVVGAGPAGLATAVYAASGLVVIEAMAHGTPVIAYDYGAVSEVLHDGVTGFIVNSEDEALMAIERVGQLDRNLISASFERRFTAEIMARAYLRVYDSLIQSYKLGRAG